jgi:hypothetical protein
VEAMEDNEICAEDAEVEERKRKMETRKTKHYML